MIKEIKEYFNFQLMIRYKELIEYKSALWMWIISNLSYMIISFFIVFFVSLSTQAFPLYIGVLLLLTSYLIFDIANLFFISEGLFNNDSYIYALTKPFNEIITSLYNMPKRFPIIIFEIIMILFAIRYFKISINFYSVVYYIILIILGILILSYLYNLVYLITTSINKSDSCPFCYIIRDIQDIFSKYPYEIFINSRIILSLTLLLLIPFYTYEPVKALILYPNPTTLMISLVLVLILKVLFTLYYKQIFLKIYETYGG